MTLDALVARARRVQEIVVMLSTGRISESVAKHDMLAAGLSIGEIDRLTDAVRKNIIVPGTPRS